jgi:hypothetical protein
VQYAILYWLVGGSLKTSIWYDLARQFYGGKRKQVLARVRALGRSNQSVTGFVKDVEECLDR